MVAIILLCGCGREQENQCRQCDMDYFRSQLQVGDIVFRRGTGVVGRTVVTVDNEGLYSHVGVVVSVDGELCVVHAVPGESDYEGDFDRVKCDKVEQFMSERRAARGAIYRPDVEDSIMNRVVASAIRLNRKMVRFDHDYDLSDTTRLYCTELIEYIFGLEGISLSEGRRTDICFPSFSGAHIMPSDLTKSSKLKVIYSF